MLNSKRAYSDEDKLKRRSSILAAAARLFESNRFRELTMTDIAKECGVSKGTLYVYFDTKESLFLSYAKQEIDEFFERLLNALSSHQKPSSVDVVVNAIGFAYAQRKPLIRLFAMLHRVLESNVELERVVEFRRSLLPYMDQVGRELEEHLPFIVEGSGSRLLLTIHCMALGFQQLAEPAPVLRQALIQPGMEVFQFDFESSLMTVLTRYLKGMEMLDK